MFFLKSNKGKYWKCCCRLGAPLPATWRKHAGARIPQKTRGATRRASVCHGCQLACCVLNFCVTGFFGAPMPSTWLARADMGLGVNAIHICTMHLVSMGSVPVTVIHICTMRVVGDLRQKPQLLQSRGATPRYLAQTCRGANTAEDSGRHSPSLRVSRMSTGVLCPQLLRHRIFRRPNA